MEEQVCSFLQPTDPNTPSLPVFAGSGKKAGAVGDSPAHTWLPKPTRAHRDQQVSEHTPSLAIHDQSATIQGAMEILQDLRRQIQAGLELARRPRKLLSSKPQNPAGKRQQGPQSAWDMQGSFSKSAWAATEGTCSSLDRARDLYSQQLKEAVAEQESCPQRAWTAQGQDTSFQGPGSTPEKPSPFSQRPWSALAWQTCPQRAWEAQGQDTSFQRSGSPIKKPGPFSQRPWSALAGQACSQRTHTACKGWEVPGSSPWSSVARPHPALQQPWSSSPVQRSSLHSEDECVVPPLSEVKLAWPETAQGFPQSKPAKEQDTRESPPCPRPQRSLGQPHSSESLRDFMRQKARARRQQAMEQKALAAHALELRNQRLQEVYRKQREAILGKAIPVVSRRSPGIVTFVPNTGVCAGWVTRGLAKPLRLGFFATPACLLPVNRWVGGCPWAQGGEMALALGSLPAFTWDRDHAREKRLGMGHLCSWLGCWQCWGIFLADLGSCLVVWGSSCTLSPWLDEAGGTYLPLHP